VTSFEWDEEKNRANQRKHGVSFEEASTMRGVARRSGLEDARLKRYV
jgi:uncharacterized DUF497 family protein